jgi:hypothetical protein
VNAENRETVLVLTTTSAVNTASKTEACYTLARKTTLSSMLPDTCLLLTSNTIHSTLATAPFVDLVLA